MSLRRVALFSVAVPPPCRIPPPVVALLALNVLLVIVAAARFCRPPPAPLAALALSVTPARSSVPATFAMPAPLVALFVRIQTSESVVVPPFRIPPPVVAGPIETAPLCVISLPMTPASMWNVPPGATYTPPPSSEAVLSMRTALAIDVVPAAT